MIETVSLPWWNLDNLWAATGAHRLNPQWSSHCRGKEGMNSSLMLRRFFCFNAPASASASASASVSAASSSSKKKPLVFLGSPQVLITH